MKKKQIIKELDNIQRKLMQLECEHKITVIRKSEYYGYDKKCRICGKVFKIKDKELIERVAQELKDLCIKNNIKEEDIEI